MAVPGSVVGVGKLITPGGQQGPKGDAGTAANVPLADITQNGLLRQNTGNTTDFVDGTNNCQPIVPQITSVRLRSFNAIGNPNFEVDQKLCGTSLSLTPSVRGGIDRWTWVLKGTMLATFQQIAALVAVPTTSSFYITDFISRITLTTTQASLGTTDNLHLQQLVEGPLMRALYGDVHSVSLLVRSSVANLKFGFWLQDSVSAYTLCKLCSLGAANTWTLITLPALPLWTASGTWPSNSGQIGYILGITLSAGSSLTIPANNIWQASGNYGAVGQSNFAASAVNSTFDLAFCQHEPGSTCTTLQDKPFNQNYDEVLRHYCKSYDYVTKPGTASVTNGLLYFPIPASQNPFAYIPYKKIMAKVPTLTAYAYDGTVNAVRDSTASANKTVSGPGVSGDSSFNGFSLSVAANAAAWLPQFHFTADTGM